jgi:hypothetical protein
MTLVWKLLLEMSNNIGCLFYVHTVNVHLDISFLVLNTHCLITIYVSYVKVLRTVSINRNIAWRFLY